MRELLALPGVGPKVAHLYSQVGLGETRGIAVDTHVHRIAARLGWTRGARDAEASRKQLEAWLPPDRWQELSPLMVGFGQRVCADRPACRKCHLAAERLCPQIGLALDGAGGHSGVLSSPDGEMVLSEARPGFLVPLPAKPGRRRAWTRRL